MSPVTAILLLVLIVVGIILAVRAYRNWKVEKCTASASGVIVDVRIVESTSSTTHYFVIDYKVDGAAYRFSQQVSRLSNYDQYIGTQVPVYYDPDKPKRAWADTPGHHPYSRFKGVT